MEERLKFKTESNKTFLLGFIIISEKHSVGHENGIFDECFP